jgi:hypothetical protein
MSFVKRLRACIQLAVPFSTVISLANRVNVDPLDVRIAPNNGRRKSRAIRSYRLIARFHLRQGKRHRLAFPINYRDMRAVWNGPWHSQRWSTKLQLGFLY